MSDFKFSPDLFLETQELSRLEKFLDADGFRLHLLQNTFSYGIIKDVEDTTFNNYKVEAGTNNKTIKISNNSFALDNQGRIIFKESEDNIAPPDDGNFYWVKVVHAFSPKEDGTATVDVNGNLVGTDTKFTEVLRGKPNFPSKISFPGASLNIGEYEVSEVTNDTNVILSGVLQAESNLKYQIVGTFTAGHIPPTVEKFPFQYDSVILSFELETVLNTSPTKIEGEEFYIARVKVVGLNVQIEDKRTEFWKTKASFDISEITTPTNVLIGVENVKFDAANTPKDKNIVEVAWGFRTTNWTIDSALRKFSISEGEGGRFKSAGNFTNGDFDGWRIYAQDGTYKIITESIKQATQINLILETLDIDDYTDGDELIIVPNVEEVEFLATNDGAIDLIPNIKENFVFPVNQGVGKMRLVVPVDVGTYSYNIKWRYKVFGNYTLYQTLPSDTTIGFYNESSFEDNGTLKANDLDRTSVLYTADPVNGYIALTPNPRSYNNVINILDTGDLFGVNTRQFSNGSPIIDLEVGVDKNTQIFEGTIEFSVDHVVNLKTTNAKAGNAFWLIFNADITPVSENLTINGGYINAGNPGEVLKTFNATDFDYQKIPERKVVLRCVYDGNAWVSKVLEEDTAKLNDVVLKASLDFGDFDGTGKGTTKEWLGWAIANGNNGTVDMVSRVPVGFNAANPDYQNFGNTGGSQTISIEEVNMPSHSHTIDPDGGHLHTVPLYWEFRTVASGSFEAVRGIFGTSGPNTTNAISTSEGVHDHGGTGSIGGDLPIDIRQSWTVVGYIQRIPYTP